MPNLSLGEALEVLLDHRGKTPAKLGADFTSSGVPVASAIMVSNGLLDLTEARYVSRETYRRWMPTPTRNGDVLLTSEAPLGRVARLKTDDPLVLGQRLFCLRGRPGVLDSGFLFYALQTGEIQRALVSRSTGTTVTGIRQSALRDLEIFAPDYATQQGIAKVLSALDDKIAANRSIVTAADALAAALYTDAATELLPLSFLARFVNGRAFTKGASGTGRVVVRIAELNSGLGASTVYSDADVATDHVAEPGDLLFAWSGSLTAKRWFRPPAIINQHIFKVVADRGHPLWLVNGALAAKLADYRATAADKATTMGHIQRHHLDELAPVPSAGDVERLDVRMTALWSTALAAEVENERLAATRDELLPLLISGRVTVREAERTVEAAT